MCVSGSGKCRYFTLFPIFVIDDFYGPQGPTVVAYFSADGISFPPTSAGVTVVCTRAASDLRIDRTLSQSIPTNLRK